LSKTSVRNYHYFLRNILEDYRYYLLCIGSLKSRIVFLLSEHDISYICVSFKMKFWQ